MAGLGGGLLVAGWHGPVFFAGWGWAALGLAGRLDRAWWEHNAAGTKLLGLGSTGMSCDDCADFFEAAHAVFIAATDGACVFYWPVHCHLTIFPKQHNTAQSGS